MATSVNAAITLKWAHVYEPEHPYHKSALWAAEELKKRTDGRVELSVYPSSSLGKEVDINEGLNIGAVDIIFSGAAFSEQFYGPVSISNYPFMVRDFEHWKSYRDSDLFDEIKAGYKDATNNEITALSYYGQRHVTSNTPITEPKDMEGLKIRVPNAPLFMMFPQATGANPTPMAFSEVYLALQQGVVDAQENPLPTIKFKKFYEVQSNINLTGHITISSLTLISGLTKMKVGEEDYAILASITDEASMRASEEVNKSEKELGAWFESQGVRVNQVDKAAFQKAVAPLLLGDDLPFTQEQASRLKAL
ncbi:sialic acid TRAP transporter substrate-binding protein SiaP [Enterovibrio sp. ZSDZ35]|uniref:Sialic acid TRAP transporter substrate-binding protein SiaP n=1 Tax=Enterovibrio qingdaonensis TaxID=2899818 RepID=A0ABT5QP61_9GAMM|nr:sialic acid TRAP transporter substrate-binding protein SiaP [Enterovibrio sp. ZSDZ35]MDD1782772.1 sialic acid TRAP transporter substrate-binding protein SiaP [Enterovibrio sp. ZSDZ35]